VNLTSLTEFRLFCQKYVTFFNVITGSSSLHIDLFFDAEQKNL